ncbi:MAG TPA: sigma-54 dependent transcriptional regulator [Candidatus Sulfotelmatobacter sp.]|nr:sigma-54 dependent transcriptional regulator [Candidatus Sulfotelmatobacter sp.]
MAKALDILIVDDDERLRTAVRKVLASEGYTVECVAGAQDAMEQLKQRAAALVLSDLRLSGLDGITLLKEIRELRPETEIVMITGHGSVEKAVESIRFGAYDFIEKPLNSDQLLKIVARALEKQRLTSENRRLRHQLEQRRGLDSLIGNDSRILAVKRLVRQIAPTDINVLIQGESGAGKEVIADSLHDLSDRRDKPFLKISCAAIPETLLESELFGYERGAFTGANAARPGKFELADDGTLMLDEIAEMSPQLQAKLLRVLQDGRFQRLGSAKEIRVNVRLICATHADIPRAIEEGRFRHDLYYRINTIHVVLPPLRERKDDIPLLAGHFLGLFAAKMKKNVTALAPDALQKLQMHSWPGNVRELEHVIQRAVALAQGKIITDITFAPQVSDISKPDAGTKNGCVSIPIGTTVDDATRKLVEATIQHCAGNKLQAAKMLGIAPRTMYRHFSK